MTGGKMGVVVEEVALWKWWEGQGNMIYETRIRRRERDKGETKMGSWEMKHTFVHTQKKKRVREKREAETKVGRKSEREKRFTNDKDV